MLSAERRAVLLLLALAIAGQGVRHLATKPGEAPGQVELLSVLPAGSPVAQRDSAMHQSRPLSPGEQIDVDVAAASELARLPRVGLALAKTIVADRDTHGVFGSLTVLDRMPGIGPGLLRTMAPHLTFSGAKQRALATTASSAGVGIAFAPQGGGDVTAHQ